MTTWIQTDHRGVVLPPRESARLLRRQHLQAQVCNEGAGLIRAAVARDRGEPRGYQAHPASVMWVGHTRALAAYLLDHVEEWCARGYAAPVTVADYELALDPAGPSGGTSPEPPPWWGRSPLHWQHARSLVARAAGVEHYAETLPGVPWIPWDEPFLWPPDPTHPGAEERLRQQVDAYHGTWLPVANLDPAGPWSAG